MSPFTLTAEEVVFVQALEDGGADPLPKDSPSPGRKPAKEIRAQVLVRIILGLPLQFSADDSRVVKITNAGIQLSNATVSGDLNLEDAAGPGGSPLPRLSFEGCWFEGKIRLMRSRLRSLSFRKSRFSELNAADAHIDGPVDLTEVRGINENPELTESKRNGQCWVVLATTKIAGRVTAKGARLVSPPKRDDYVYLSKHAIYALDLRAARVHSSILLRGDFVADGGVCVSLAIIDGSLWANGATCIATEESAFAADYAVVRGSIYLRSYDFNQRPDTKTNLAWKSGSKRFRAIGSVSLFAAKIGGSLYMQGASLKKSPDAKDTEDDRTVLNACNAEIGGDCYFSCWQSEAPNPELHRFESDGELHIDSARIRNDLSFSGAAVPYVVANNIDVGGDCSFSVRSETVPKQTYRFACAQVEINGASIKGNLDLRGAMIESDGKRAKFSADGISVEGNCYCCCWNSETAGQEVHRFQSDGELCINSARFRNDLSFSGAIVQRVVAKNIEVGGNCNFSVHWQPGAEETYRFQCAEVEIRGAALKGNLDFRGAMIRSVDNAGRISAAGISVGGNCLMGAYTREPGAGSTNRKTVGVRFACYGNIVLTESRITNSLRMDGALLRAPRDSAQPALDLSGTTVGGEVQLMTWHDSEAVTSFPFTAKGGSVVLRLTGVKIAQKLILNGARIVAAPKATPGEISQGQSVYALNAANAEIGGKASLSTFVGRCRGASAHFRFKAKGEINFTAATITLGLDMAGARLSAEGGNKRKQLALDLSRARMKFVWFRPDGAEGSPGESFQVSGDMSLEHARIDADVDLRGAKLDGHLIAEYVKVGTSVWLEATIISRRSIEDLTQDEHFSGAATDSISHAGQTIARATIMNRHIVRQLDADLSLKAGVIGNALIVNGLQVCKPQRGAGSSEYRTLSHGTVDLRALQVGELQDDGGLGWGRDVRLWLDGFRYQRLPEVPLDIKPEALGTFLKIVWKRLWNPTELAPQKSVDGDPETGQGTYQGPPERSPRSMNEARGPMFWLYNQIQRGGVWERRLRWLSLQYFTPDAPSKKEYSPDAYEQLVNGLNATGSYEDARRISSARLTLEARLNHSLLKWAWFLFRIFFDYGFSIGRAVSTFVLCILLGAWAVKIADSRNVLIVNTGNPETRIFEDAQGKPVIYSVEAEKSQVLYKDDIPCGERIHSALYALDVFVPVLDLHQQAACSINPKRTAWRYGQAAYAVLGWILTPLTILTMTGILRRHIER